MTGRAVTTQAVNDTKSKSGTRRVIYLDPAKVVTFMPYALSFYDGFA
jgi:hypothetical protein